MKNLILTLAILSILSCKAQTPIYEGGYGSNDGVYYKDMNNDYNTFIGTWLYTNGNTSLTVTLQKKVMKHIQDDDFDYYTDALVGEYRYVENGVEKINTLSNLLIDYDDPYTYNINGGTISKPGDPLCNNCEPNATKVRGSLKEGDCYLEDTLLVLRHYVDNGVEKLSFFLNQGVPLYGLNGEEPDCTTYQIPSGQYTLIKQ